MTWGRVAQVAPILWAPCYAALFIYLFIFAFKKIVFIIAFFNYPIMFIFIQ